jgi:porphobilinogen synthase
MLSASTNLRCIMSALLVFTEIPKIKKTYQMDYANRIEAIKEALWDGRGSHVLRKPELRICDIVREVKNA